MAVPPRLLRTPLARDVALALALTVVGQVELALADHVAGPRPLQAIAFAVITLAVAARRRAPLTALLAGGAGMTLTTVLGEAEGPVAPFAALIIVTYSVASYATLRRAVLGLVAAFASILVYALIESTTFGDELGNLVIFGAVWSLGLMVRTRERRAVAAEATVARERAAHEAEQASAVRAERLRIARELHDVVAHGVSGMVLHAGAARQALAVEPDAARGSLLEIESSGRQALAELRQLLSVLRMDDALVGDVVGAALARARDAGLALDVDLAWDPDALDPRVAAAAGRIVQEAVTNVLRHAPTATMLRVAIADRGDMLALEIEDDGTAAADAMPGFGLVGMRERAAELGGTATAGPRADGGWRVVARIPTGVA